jgi:hypothetical protein
MTDPELTKREQAQKAIDAALTRLQECVLKPLVLTAPIEWQAALDKLSGQIDAALKAAAAEAGRDPLTAAIPSSASSA